MKAAERSLSNRSNRTRSSNASSARLRSVISSDTPSSLAPATRGARTQPAPSRDPAFDSVRQNDAVFGDDIGLIRNGPLYGAVYGLSVLRMDPLHDRPILNACRRREPEHPVPILGAPNLVASDVPHPHAQPGRRGRQAQTLLALAQYLIRSLPSNGIGEDLRNGLQPLDERFRPDPFRFRGVEAQRADQRSPAGRQRNYQRALDAEMSKNIPVASSLGRHFLHAGNGDYFAGQKLLQAPGKVLPGVHRIGGRRAFVGPIQVRQSEESRRLGRPLPEAGQIDPEALADATLGVPDQAVYIRGGNVDKLRRQIGDQRLESQAGFEFFPDATRLDPARAGIEDLAIILGVADRKSIRFFAHAAPRTATPPMTRADRRAEARCAVSSVKCVC